MVGLHNYDWLDDSSGHVVGLHFNNGLHCVVSVIVRNYDLRVNLNMLLSHMGGIYLNCGSDNWRSHVVGAYDDMGSFRNRASFTFGD